jgi:hypothetical protein
METERILAYELKENRIAVHKIRNESSYLVTNTFTGKALLCISIEQALDTFDFCIESLHGNNLMN